MRGDGFWFIIDVSLDECRLALTNGGETIFDQASAKKVGRRASHIRGVASGSIAQHAKPNSDWPACFNLAAHGLRHSAEDGGGIT
jgi:hypothetical protein